MAHWLGDPAFFSKEKLRRATVAELPRLAVVATAGFYDAPQFSWERPYHHQYPHDTYLSYLKLFSTCISDPGCLCYTIEDAYDEREDEKTEATIATEGLYQVPRATERIPVGAAIWRLPKDSHRQSVKTPAYPGTEQETQTSGRGGAQRDVHQIHRAQLRSKVHALSSKHFGCSDEKFYAMLMFVIHPAYRGRGHGTSLLNLGAGYADADQRAIRLFSQPKAVSLYQKVGFEALERDHVENGGVRFEFTAMIRQPVLRNVQ